MAANRGSTGGIVSSQLLTFNMKCGTLINVIVREQRYWALLVNWIILRDSQTRAHSIPSFVGEKVNFPMTGGAPETVSGLCCDIKDGCVSSKHKNKSCWFQSDDWALKWIIKLVFPKWEDVPGRYLLRHSYLRSSDWNLLGSKNK